MLAACEQGDTGLSLDSKQLNAVVDDVEPRDQIGQSLNQIAGRTILPEQQQTTDASNQTNPHSLAFVGRYRVAISCRDAFAGCDIGTADYILNLLPDGTAHRIFVHMGKVHLMSNQKELKDSWYYDVAQQHIVVIRGNGVGFYYQIDQDKNLVMDLEKIATATENNKQFFAQGHPMPQHAYVLTRLL